MTGLRPPPKTDASSRVVVKLFFLLVMLAGIGVLIWTTVTNQRIELVETTPYEDVELAGPSRVGSLTIHVEHDGIGNLPVILLHDFDVAGGALWDSVVDRLGDDATAVRVDLPGFGLSSRLPEEGPQHTVSSMANVVADVVSQRFGDRPVIVAGVGLGGEVAAELAVTRPELFTGLVMIDVDFYKDDGWIETIEQLPFVGPAATFTFDGGGVRSQATWAPLCGSGGWCPTKAQSDRRELAESIAGTTASLRAFRRTPEASLVPSRLGDIAVPVVYVWSGAGVVPRESVDMVVAAIPGLAVVESDSWKAHLEDPEKIVAAIYSFGS